MRQELTNRIQEICCLDRRYTPDAYDFVLEGLSFAQKKFKKTKHVRTQELLEALKELILKKYGPLAITVLEHWGIQGTEDFGHVVFNLVKYKVLSKTDEDSLEQFCDSSDFREAFQGGYRKQLEERIREMR